MRGNARLPDLFILKLMTKKLATPGITTHNFNKRITHTGSASTQFIIDLNSIMKTAAVVLDTKLLPTK